MKASVKKHEYPIRVELSDKAALEMAASKTGQSINQLFVLCVRHALPEVTARLSRGSGRITNVDPLPEAVLERLYSRPERDEAGLKRLTAAQAKGGRD